MEVVVKSFWPNGVHGFQAGSSCFIACPVKSGDGFSEPRTHFRSGEMELCYCPESGLIPGFIFGVKGQAEGLLNRAFLQTFPHHLSGMAKGYFAEKGGGCLRIHEHRRNQPYEQDGSECHGPNLMHFFTQS